MPLSRLLAVTAVAISAAFAIVAAHQDDRHGVHLFKPLTTTLVIVVSLWVFTPARRPYQDWILLGLAFSLVGDVFLMLGATRFLWGLAAFLVAQLAYAWAFTLDVGVDGSQLPWLAPFAFFALLVVIVLWRGLPSAAMRGAVAVYAAVIALMAWRAAVRLQAPLVTMESGTLALAGACLFLASDAVLAVNRFRRPFRLGEPVTLATYWTAQLLIAMSVHA